MKRFLSGLMLWMAFFATFGVSVYYQNIGSKRVLKNAPFFDTWQLGGRSGEMMKLFALRYDMLAADFLWLRSIQSFGGRGMSNRDWRPIYNQFQTITDLDPYFKDAYIFGNLVIGDEGGYKEPGLELLEKGTFNVHTQYRIPFEAMYVAHWQMKKDQLARWYGTIASKRLDAPEWITRMVAYIDVSEGEYYIGFDRFVGNLLEGVEAEEPALQNIALNKAADTINKWNAATFARAADEFTSRTGRLPRSVNELADMPAMQNYETADMGKLLASVLKYSDAFNKRGIGEDLLANFVPPDARVFAAPIVDVQGRDDASLPAMQDVVFQDSLTTVSGLPTSPTGKPYMINLARIGQKEKHKPEDIFAPQGQLENDAREMLAELRSHVARRKQELDRNPESLKEVFYTDFNTTEPLGGQWQYDPATGVVKMSSRPSF